LLLLIYLVSYSHCYVEITEAIKHESDHKCEYVKTTKDLNCHCLRSSMVVPSISQILNKIPDQRVESLSFNKCSSLDLNISTVDLLWTALYQIRIDDTEYVTIRGIELLPDDSLDIHVNNVKKHFNLIGDLKCTSCEANMNSSENTLPLLSLQIKDSVQANIQYVKLTNIDFRLKSRNVENIEISNCEISGLQQHGIEIFYTDKLKIQNSVLNAASNTSLLLNHVNLFSVDHTIGLSNHTFDILSQSTTLQFSCTVPQQSTEGLLYSWDTELCGPPGLSVLLSRGEGLLQSGGVSVCLVLTGVSTLVLLGVILVILHLQKRGKLDSLM